MPVVIIVFRRPELTLQVLEAVAEYAPQKLYVVADGPRASNPSDTSLTSATRALFDQLPWDCELHRVFADENLGLRDRVLSGLDHVFQLEETAIILEDDCVPSIDFFAYAAQVLEHHQENKQVALLSANNFGLPKSESNEYFFSLHAHIWGWATWRRTWQEFRSRNIDDYISESERVEILSAIPGRSKRRFFGNLLSQQHELDSWAISFSSFCYRNKKLVAVPKVNLAKNIGFGSDSTHTKFESYADEIPLGKLRFPLSHPAVIEPNLIEMKRESMGKTIKWITFPVLHPFNFLGRVFRYCRITLAGIQNRS